MANLFYKDKPVIGIDITNTDLRVMSIDPNKWLVLGYGSLELNPIKIREALEGNSTYLTDSLNILMKEKLIGTLGSNHAVIGLPTAKSYSRTFNLPSETEKNLADAVEIEVDQYIPLPASTLYIDYEVIERDKKSLTVLMSAINKSIVDRCISSVEAAGLMPIMIEPRISAVSRVLAATEEANLPTVIVDMGPDHTDIAILVDDNIRATSSLPIGGNTLTIELSKKLGISLENAHQLKVLNGLNAGSRQAKITTALQPTLDHIVNETQKVIRYYNERLNKNKKLEQLLIVGGGSNLPGIGEYFTNALVMAARVASPWQKLDFGKLPDPARQFRPRYIAVAGLAAVKPGDIWK